MIASNCLKEKAKKQRRLQLSIPYLGSDSGDKINILNISKGKFLLYCFIANKSYFLRNIKIQIKLTLSIPPPFHWDISNSASSQHVHTWHTIHKCTEAAFWLLLFYKDNHGYIIGGVKVSWLLIKISYFLWRFYWSNQVKSNLYQSEEQIRNASTF